MNEKSTILVVEDNLTTSKTLGIFLAAENYDVEFAFNGHDGIQRYLANRHDLILLDLMLPDVDGLQVCQSVRSHSDVPIVILTAKSTEDEIVEGLENGADDYVCKPFGAKELLARIRRCLRQKSGTPGKNQPIRVGEIELELERRLVKFMNEPIKLTKSEFEILSMLMRNPGRVFTRDQLIQTALGPSFDGYDRTIDTHIWSLRKKLGEPRGNPKYILSEPGIGYRLSDQHAH